IMCLVALRGAKDFQADDSIEFHTLDDHHIFPKAYLSRQKTAGNKPIPSERVNSIVNRTLISAQTNRSISRKSPSNYVAQLVPADRCTEIMRSHFIDDDALAAMRADNFEAFLDARELSLMTEAITR